jgi:DNA-binding CsgD family transcriptional regulator
VALQVDGGVRVIDSMHCGRFVAGAADRVSIAAHGFAVRLACVYRNDRRQSCMVTTGELAALQGLAGMPAGVQELRNAAIHRVTLLSGAAYRCLLFNVPQDQLERCRFRFQLVAAHLKMALSRALPPLRRGCDTSLTAREREVLQWMIQGKSNREISRLLGISTITLKNHVNKLYRKLDVQGRSEAVARGTAAGAKCRGDSQ